MKNKISLFALLLSVSTFSANKLPINIDFDINTAYNFEKVTKKEFDAVGLGNLIKGDLNFHQTSFGVNLGINKSLNTKYKKLKIEVGGGIGANIAIDTHNNFSEVKESHKKLENFKELEKKLDVANFESVKNEQDFEKFVAEYSSAYKNVRDIEYKLIKEKEQLFKLNRQISERKKYKEVYKEQKDREELKKMYTEIEKKLKEQVEKRNNLNRELNEYINKHPEIAKEKLSDDATYKEKLEKLREEIKKTDHYFAIFIVINVDKNIVDKLDEDTSKYENNKKISEERIKALDEKRKEIEDSYKEKYGTYNRPSVISTIDEKIKESEKEEAKVPNLVKHFKNGDGTFDFEKDAPTVEDDESIRGENEVDPSTPTPKAESEDDENEEGEEEGSSEEDTFRSLTEDDIENVKSNWEEAMKNYDELKKEYEEKIQTIQKNNNNAIDELGVAVEKNKLNYEFSTYASTKLAYSINDDFEIVTGIDLGMSIANNKLYTYSKCLQDKSVTVDGKPYLLPANLKKVKINPLVRINVGGRYKNFNLGIYASYTRKASIGLNLGYRFK